MQLGTGAVIGYLALGLLLLGGAGYYLGARKARALDQAGKGLHSQIGHYGGFVLLGYWVPALLVAILGALLHLTKIYSGSSLGFIVLLGGAVLGIAGLALTYVRVEPQLRARVQVERVIRIVLFVSSLISIMTTVGIVFSILFQALKFFQLVPFWEFATGTTWAPETAFLLSEGAVRGDENAAKPKFGAVPLFAGTFMITFIALMVAVPIGLLSAIYMTEYAPPRLRGAAKPILEVLAGIPTVVYGFFAAITVAPLVVRGSTWLGEHLGPLGGIFLNVSFENALTCGLVMGIMIIPFVSSLSDDVINAVPSRLKEGALALGTTQSETMTRVILPAAMPGIVSAVLLAISRALGETMIVVMAAGLRPNLSWNPLEGMTTVTVRIVSSLVGDKAFDSPETLSAFALGLSLFVLTLILNVCATIIIRRFKRKYVL